MTEVRVRRAREEDADALVDLFVAVVEEGRWLGTQPSPLLHHGDVEVDDGVNVAGHGPAHADRRAGHGERTAPRIRRLRDHGVRSETPASTR